MATYPYPGVYIEEVKSQVHTISGVATSITAFVGYTARRRDNRALRIFSFADFERAFGGLAADSELSYAVQQFFANGGSDVYVVRVPKNDAVAAIIELLDSVGAGGKKALRFTALSKGTWANDVLSDVDYDGILPSDTHALNLTITDLDTGTTESFDNVTMDNAKSNFVEAVVNDEDNGSKMVSVKVVDPAADRPVQTGTVGADLDLTKFSDPNKAYTIKISSDIPAGKIANVPITVVDAGEIVPSSVLGMCRLLERKANLALQNALPGAAIRCVPSSSGKGIRVFASFLPDKIPDSLDAEITFAAGTPNNADSALKLTAGAINIAHYVLGKGRTHGA